jgi:phosphoribosyl 1,2-cyclic phosphate phosphodiesterase
MKNSFLFLGTGASMGTPVVTCKCEVCTSKSSFNHRLRPSGLLKLGEERFLIDAGPDFRQQGLKYGIDRLDGVLITHTHFDHVAGLDDLRVFYFLQKKTLPCLLSQDSYDEIKRTHGYFFNKSNDDVMGGSRFEFHIIKKDFGTEKFGGHAWQVMTFEQGGMKVTGYRLGSFAYVMDLKNFSAEIYQALKGVEVLVISALRYRPSPAHLSMEEAVAFATRVGAKQTWFSHIAHDLDHTATNQQLPPGVKLAYDGLEIPLHVE